MTDIEVFILLIASALTQASFQLSVSMVTVMSGHALGAKTALDRLSRLTASFSLGVITMVALSLSFFALVLSNVFTTLPAILWSITSGLMVGIGFAVWFFYYRYNSAGTVLWVPRPMADFLSKRARSTTIAPEAFALGLTSVIGEAIFTAVPTLLGALLLTRLAPPLQLAGLLTYTVIATLPLAFIAMQVSAGGSLARIQRWRERNKRFMQFAAGSALIILGVYVYVQEVVTPLSTGGTI